MPLLPGVTLQPHQQALRDEASEAAAQGLPFRRMALWQVGAGKSLGALGAVDALGGRSAVVAPAAVRPSFKLETQRLLSQPVPVVSYNQAANGKLPEVPNNLIIDEAQRLGSTGPQSSAVTDLAMKARNVILLSGTPIRNHPRELAGAVSILSGKPMSQDDFTQRYVGVERRRPGGILGWLRGEPAVEQPVIAHEEELRNLLRGKIDFYENASPPPGAPSSVNYEDVESTMTPGQAGLYEGMFQRLPRLLRWKLRWNYPLTDSELVRSRSFLTGPRQVGLSDLPYRPDRDPLKAFENSGKLKTAMGRLEAQLKDPRSKAIVYSNFLHAGLRPYSAALNKAGIPHATFHGGLSDEERKQLVSDFNSGRTRVALVAPAGAEGISLKGAQLIQLLDKHWNEARMRQAQARGIRFDSHTGLPEDLRGVRVERYIAKLPLGVSDRLLAAMGFDRESRRSAVDDYLEAMSTRKEKLNRQFIDLLRDVASENRHRIEKGASTISLDSILDAAESDLACLDGGDRHSIAKLAELVPQALPTTPFREIKRHSDLGTPDGYAEKTRLLRESISRDPSAWKIDSVLNPEFVGVTHVGTGWRYHMRKRDVSDLLPPFEAATPIGSTPNDAAVPAMRRIV